MTNTQLTSAYLDEIFAAFNAQDLDLIASYFAEDGVFQAPLGPPPHGNRAVGKQQIKDFLASRWKQIPSMHWKDQTTSIVGNTATTAWTVAWTDADGEHEWDGCDLYVFDGKKIKLKDTYWKRPAA